MPTGLDAYLPTTEDGLYIWTGSMMAGYLILAYAIQFATGKKPRSTHKAGVERVFNAATFASSIMLVLGVFSPTVLALIGNLKPYLLFAGFLGGVYSIRALVST